MSTEAERAGRGSSHGHPHLMHAPMLRQLSVGYLDFLSEMTCLRFLGRRARRSTRPRMRDHGLPLPLARYRQIPAFLSATMQTHVSSPTPRGWSATRSMPSCSARRSGRCRHGRTGGRSTRSATPTRTRAHIYQIRAHAARHVRVLDRQRLRRATDRGRRTPPGRGAGRERGGCQRHAKFDPLCRALVSFHVPSTAG
jgi:hypothetical protein